MTAEWFLARGGQERVGPLSSQQLKQMASNGQVTANDLVWREGMAQWVPASQVKGLVSSSSGGSAIAQAPPPPAPVPAPMPEIATMSVPEPAAFATPDGRGVPGGAELEPWYYTFLDRYSKILMFLLIGMFLLAYLGTVIMYLIMSPMTGIVYAVVLLIPLVVYSFVVIFWVALILLAVDAGRNLRSIDRKVTKE